MRFPGGTTESPQVLPGPPPLPQGAPPTGNHENHDFPQIFQNILKYSQIFSNILKYFQIFSNILNYSQYISNISWNIQGPLGYSSPGGEISKGCLVAKQLPRLAQWLLCLFLMTPFAWFSLGAARGGPPPLFAKMLFWGPSGGLKERLKNALEKNRHGDATPRMGAFHRSSPDGVKGAVCHKKKTTYFY